MDYKEANQQDKVTLFKWVLDLDMPEQRKKKVFNYLYEEYRITHEAYKDINEYIDGIAEEDLRNFSQYLKDKDSRILTDEFWAQLDDGQKYNI